MDYQFSKSAAKYALKNSGRIDEYLVDSDGHWAWTVRGWCFEHPEQHCVREDTAREIISSMRTAKPCRCDSCLGDYRLKKGEAWTALPEIEGAA
jgi:hypothetical protein